MSTKYPGGFISSTEPTVSPLSAKGIWTLAEALRYKTAGEWPVSPTYVAIQGVFATANVGQAESVIPVLLTGLQATGSVNDLTVIGSAIVALDTVSGTGGVGQVSISLPVVFDEYFNLNSMLLADSLANTFITDEGPNKFVITPNGDTRPSAFSPYNTSWSNYFDGSGDYLTGPSGAAFDITQGDFTLEAWVYRASSDTDDYIFSQRPAVGNSGWEFRINSTGTFQFFYTGGSSIISSGTIPANTWTHIAAARSGSTCRLFINGSLDTSGSFSNGTSNTGTTLKIGADNVLASNFHGYMSNARLVKGTAVYTAAFTPSTEPLTAISGTSLLTCQSNQLVDVSANNFAITKNGDVKVTSFGPFSTDYRATPESYSVAFDGTGDYLNCSPTAFGTGDFTIECYVYFSGASVASEGVFHVATSTVLPSSVQGVAVASGASGGWTLYYNNGSQNTNTSLTASLNTWIHVAVVRSGGTIYLYINGVLNQSQADTANYTNTNAAIGGFYSTSYLMQGCVSNFRIVNSALYTSNFVPPTSPLTAVSGTSLLTCQSPMVIDNSSNDFAITVNGQAQPVTANPFDGSPITYSGYFDGSGDYLNFGINDTSLDFGSGDFTVENWVNFSSVTGDRTLYSRYDQSSDTGFVWRLSTTNSPSGLRFYVGAGGGNGLTIQKAWSPVAGVWYHIALVRNSNNIYIYINGELLDTATAYSGTIGTVSNTNSRIGAFNAGDGPLHGYISNSRVVKGTAVYTSNFTPPTSPLTAVSGTSLLTCQSPGFIDNSSNAFAITVNGNTVVKPNNPLGYNEITQTAITDTTGSGYFDGSGDFLTVARNASFFPVANEDFTFEAWVYLTAAPGATGSTIFTAGEYGALSDFFFYIDPSRQLTLYLTTGAVTCSNTSTLVPINAWTHVAVSRSGTSTGNVKVFVNGVGQSFTTNNTTVGSGNYNLSIGADQDGNESNLTGYISNIRIVKGTAVYTANFTPLATPLTSVTNTSLLTLQHRVSYNNSQPIDTSGIKNIITRNGNASVGSYSPFTPNGWSGYFDGSDYLGVASFPAFGTGDYTVEWWAYKNDTWSDAYDITDGGSGAFAIYTNVNGQLHVTRQSVSGAAKILGQLGSLNPNQWYYFAIVRQSGNVRCYVDGQPLAAAVADTNSYGASTKLFGTADGYWPGYISNFRVFTSAIYDISASSIDVPTEPFGPTAADGTAASLLLLRSPTFNDESPSRLAITRYNDSKITPFSPFSPNTVTPDSYSVYFDGTGDYLSVPDNAALELASFSFCIEGWLNLSSNADAVIVSKRLNISTASGFVIYYDNANTRILFFASSTGSSWNIFSNAVVGTITKNTWVHFAVYRVNDDWYGAVNGNVLSLGSSSAAINNNADAVRIGSDSNGLPILGYISNIRFVVGSSVYTSANFTPPTSPLTAIANTSLLVCQSPTFVDNSPNNFAGSVFGNTQPSTFNPFGETVTSNVEYTPAAHGGSVYFDGTGDYLSSTSSSALQFGTSNFTVEFWMYPNTVNSTFRRIVTNNNGAFDASTLVLRLNNSNQMQIYVGSTLFNSTATFTANQWYHIALVRSSGTNYFYINGVQSGSFASSADISKTTLYLGGYYTVGPAEFFDGYLSNVRAISGTALYTAAFVPPAAPVSPIAATTLLTCGNNAAIYDYTGKNDLETVGNARTVQETPYRDNHSVYFDGTGDTLTVADNAAFDLGSGDWTIELWANFGSVSGEKGLISHFASAGAGQNNGYVLRLSTGNSPSGLRLVCSTTGTDVILQAAWTPVSGAWYHIAAVRDSGNLRIYIDGVQIGTTGIAITIGNPATTFAVGTAQTVASSDMNGYISNVRLVKGTCLYTGGTTFPPPTSPLTAVSGTSLLTCNTYNFTDSSTNNFTITRNGDARISSRGPFVQNEGDRCMYFDGTGDYLSIAYSPAFLMGSSADFCMEGWVNPSVSPANSSTLYSSYDGATAGNWIIWFQSGKLGIYQFNDTNFTTGAFQSTTTIPVGAWTHFAFTRSGTVFRLFINGVQEDTFTGSVTFGVANKSVEVGRYSAGASSYFNGYLDDLRITRGFARYTSNFTPPSEPLPKV